VAGFAANLYLHAHAVADLKPTSQVAYDDFSKKSIDADRLYEMGLTVYNL
jgi:hypothetical protein